MKKKGVSHVEYIVAFLLFFGFIAAMLSFFRPIERFSSTKDVLPRAESEFAEAASVPITSISLIVDESLASDVGAYVKFPTNLADTNDRKGLWVENYEGRNITAYEGDGEIFFLLSDDLFSGGNGYVRIHISEGIFSNGETFTGSAENASDFLKVSFIDENVVLSEKKIQEIQEQYGNNYLALKETLGILSSTDFGFRVDFSDGTSLQGRKKISEQIPVYADVSRKEILRRDGSRVFAEVRVEVW